LVKYQLKTSAAHFCLSVKPYIFFRIITRREQTHVPNDLRKNLRYFIIPDIT